MIKLSKADKQLLLCIASGLPPVAWRNKCETSDQMEHWDDIRYKYQFIYYELKAFFDGQESPVLVVENKLDELLKDYYIALADLYIATYTCIRKAWHVIQIEAEKKNVKIQDTPGEAIFQIFIDDCWFDFAPCLESFFEYRPREIYNILLEVSKFALDIKKKPKDDKLINRAKKILNKINKYNSLKMQGRTLTFYLKVVQQEAKKDENLAASYSHLEKIYSNLELFLSRLTCSRHAQPAYNWVNGVKKSCK